MKDSNRIRLEKEEFELRRKYAKELHSNESSVYTFGCLLVMAVVALGTSSVSNMPTCVQKGQMDQKIFLAKNDNCHSRWYQMNESENDIIVVSK